MRKKRPVLPLVLAVILAVGMFQPMPAAAANLYFTGINDSVAPLTSSSMPYWSGGTLYVPYTVFDANQNGVGVSLGLYTSYNHRSHIVTIFNLKQMLVFDLERGTCRDDMTGAAYDARAVMRYGKPYVPLYVVCSVFGLEYSYNQLSYISQGYLVRIKSADAVLDDGLFIDRARELINNRLRDYTQSLSPAETTPTVPVSPSGPPEVDGSNVATYLAFRCESADGLSAILNTLDGTGQYALFFLAPQVIEEEGGLVRRILGTGHSVGILAREGEEEALSRGRLALEELAHTRTTLAYVPDGARAGLEEQGWVCWKETLYLEPGDSVGGTAFASTVLNRLGTRRRTVYLTLEGSGNTARVLPALLRQLSSNHYTVAVPVETRL
ncbi:MAG: hypothetical protein HFF49_12280 [Lawsonibacter sp.]|nr:hypothetical protein [Lawsonibacter sp.]